MDTSPSNPEIMDELLAFFKALADPNRLKIMGLLARQPQSVEQLAELLGVRASTVSHHLSYLSHVGLVSARAESYYNIYQMETGVLEEMAQRLLKHDTLPAVAADMDMEAFDRKILNNFLTPTGRIKELPAQQKKLLVVLKHVAQAFEPERKYSEKEVNELLKQFTDDPVTVRRYLVDFKLLGRAGGGREYWKL